MIPAKIAAVNSNASYTNHTMTQPVDNQYLRKAYDKQADLDVPLVGHPSSSENWEQSDVLRLSNRRSSM
jgi:hypothetical protein